VQTETVTILRPGTPTQDRYTNDVPGPDVRIPVVGCLVAPAAGSDLADQGRQGVVIDATVYFPKSTRPTAADRLEVRGEPYTIVGDPGVWLGSPNRWDTVVQARRVEG
jgi:hypothetical protein